MPEKTKQIHNPKRSEKTIENSPAENEETDKDDSWSRDQQEKSYYYDDAYGYEIYNPDEDEESDNC